MVFGFLRGFLRRKPEPSKLDDPGFGKEVWESVEDKFWRIAETDEKIEEALYLGFGVEDIPIYMDARDQWSKLRSALLEHGADEKALDRDLKLGEIMYNLNEVIDPTYRGGWKGLSERDLRSPHFEQFRPNYRDAKGEAYIELSKKFRKALSLKLGVERMPGEGTEAERGGAPQTQAGYAPEGDPVDLGKLEVFYGGLLELLRHDSRDGSDIKTLLDMGLDSVMKDGVPREVLEYYTDAKNHVDRYVSSKDVITKNEKLFEILTRLSSSLGAYINRSKLK